jgi:hypothetical protein
MFHIVTNLTVFDTCAGAVIFASRSGEPDRPRGRFDLIRFYAIRLVTSSPKYQAQWIAIYTERAGANSYPQTIRQQSNDYIT